MYSEVIKLCVLCDIWMKSQQMWDAELFVNLKSSRLLFLTTF